VVDVTSTILIERPPADVSAYACDPANAPAWYANIRSVDWETAPPLVIGTRIAFVATFLGRTLRYTYVVRDLVIGLRLVMSTEQGPFPMETTYTFAAHDAGTQMTLRNRGRPSGFSRPLAPFVAAAMGRANRKDLARLKAVLEGNCGHGTTRM
jgi:hypothetical protein